MKIIRGLAVIAILLLTIVGRADAPIAIDVLRSGAFVMNGIVYETRTELAAAFRELKPKAVRVRPDPDAPYEAVAEALRALKDSGIQVDLGFVGNMRDE